MVQANTKKIVEQFKITLNQFNIYCVYITTRYDKRDNCNFAKDSFGNNRQNILLLLSNCNYICTSKTH